MSLINHQKCIRYHSATYAPLKYLGVETSNQWVHPSSGLVHRCWCADNRHRTIVAPPSSWHSPVSIGIDCSLHTSQGHITHNPLVDRSVLIITPSALYRVIQLYSNADTPITELLCTLFTWCNPSLWTECILESPWKKILESWKTLEIGLCKSWKKYFNVCMNPGADCRTFTCPLYKDC